MRRVLCVCGDCHEVFWQEVADVGLMGRARLIPAREVGLEALAQNAGHVTNGRGAYFPCKCADCATAKVPGGWRKRTRDSLAIREYKTGTKAFVR